MSQSDRPSERSRDSTHTAEFDPDERASATVVSAVAAVTGVRPERLSPIYDAVEPDALDRLVDHARETRAPVDCSVAFAYEGFDVLVRGDGVVVVAE